MAQEFIRNHAVENGYHYRVSLQMDGKLHVDCIDNWAYTWGQYYADKAQLYRTLPEALRNIAASSRTIIMPDGTERRRACNGERVAFFSK